MEDSLQTLQLKLDDKTMNLLNKAVHFSDQETPSELISYIIKVVGKGVRDADSWEHDCVQAILPRLPN